MEQNKSILLQKAIRDNAEDLQKEFRDMQAWEEEMKRKEIEIRNLKDDKVPNCQIWFPAVTYLCLIFLIFHVIVLGATSNQA